VDTSYGGGRPPPAGRFGAGAVLSIAELRRAA